MQVKESDGGCEFIVEDNGKGFPQGEKDNVFDKFYRLKNSKSGGTGLGLSIAKGFTEVMDGSIRIEDNSPSGARFIIELPCKKSVVKSPENE